MEQVCVRLVFLRWKGVREGKRWKDVSFNMPERDIVAHRKSAEAVHIVVIILRLSPTLQGFLLPALTTLLTPSCWSLYKRSLALRTVKLLTSIVKNRNTRRPNFRADDLQFVLPSGIPHLRFATAKFYVWICLREKHSFVIYWHRQGTLCRLSGECLLHTKINNRGEM